MTRSKPRTRQTPSSPMPQVVVGSQPLSQERLVAYVELINTLLQCPRGKELSLLQANQDLVDAAFIHVMEQVAFQMAGQNEAKAAEFLQLWAEELRNTLDQPSATSPAPTPVQRLHQTPEQPDTPPTSTQDRTQAYMDLIKELLNCRKGTESEILAANSHLVDEGLLQQIELVATMLSEKGDGADARFLLNLAHQLSEMLSPTTPSVRLTLLNQILQAIESTKGDPQVVYGILQEHVELLDESFVQVLHDSIETTLSMIEPQRALRLAADLVIFGSLMQQFPLGQRSNTLEIALMSFQIALSVFHLDRQPQEWALIQQHLGSIYVERSIGDKAENLEMAIECFQSALQVYTREAFPSEWASVQTRLGEAYHQRVRGDRTENLERSNKALLAAIEVYRHPSSVDRSRV